MGSIDFINKSKDKLLRINCFLTVPGGEINSLFLKEVVEVHVLFFLNDLALRVNVFAMINGFDAAVGNVALLTHHRHVIVLCEKIVKGNRLSAIEIPGFERSEKPFPLRIVKPEERNRFLCLFIEHQGSHSNDVLFHLTAVGIDHPVFLQQIAADVIVVQVTVVDDRFGSLVAIAIKHFHNRGVMHGQFAENLIIGQVIVFRIIKIIRRKGVELPHKEAVLHHFEQAYFRTFGAIAEDLAVLAIFEADGAPDLFAFEDVIGFDGIGFELVADHRALEAIGHRIAFSVLRIHDIALRHEGTGKASCDYDEKTPDT